MKKMLIVLSLFALIPIILITLSAEEDEIVEYNSEGQIIFRPKEYRPSRKNFMQLIGMEPVPRGRWKMMKVKHKLNSLGAAFWRKSEDTPNFIYPANPNEILDNNILFFLSHLTGTNKGLSEDWVLPDTWDKLNESNSPFLFLGKAGGVYSESATIPLFIIKNGYQPYPDMFAVVFEDGHVETIDREQADKYWKMADE